MIYNWTDARQHGIHLFYITKARLCPLWRTCKKPFDVICCLHKMKQFHWLLCEAKNCKWSRKITPLVTLKVQLAPNFFPLFKSPYFPDQHCEKISVIDKILELLQLFKVEPPLSHDRATSTSTLLYLALHFFVYNHVSIKKKETIHM